MKLLEEKKILPKEPKILFEEKKWKGELYIEVSKKEPSLNIESKSGKFFSMVFEGKNYSEVKNWYKSFMEEAKKRTYKIDDICAWYCQCPKCAEKLGLFQAVLFGEIEEKKKQGKK